MSIDVQIVSDIHLEQRHENFRVPFDVCAPYLALLGDIGDPWSDVYIAFLEWTSKQYVHVFLILGNHEYFHNQPSKVAKRVQSIVRYLPNISFLNCSFFDLPFTDVRFLGCTLWSHVPVRDAYNV